MVFWFGRSAGRPARREPSCTGSQGLRQVWERASPASREKSLQVSKGGGLFMRRVDARELRT